MKTIITILTMVTILSTSLQAQNPQIIWQECYQNGSWGTTKPGCKYGRYIVMAKQAVLSHTIGYGQTDIILAIYDTAGNFINHHYYGGSEHDFAEKVIPDGKGNYYILANTSSSDGCISSGNKGYSDIWVVHIDSSGNILREKTYGTPGVDIAADLVPLPDGGYYLAANIQTGGGDVTLYNGGANIWVARCLSDGSILRQFTIGDTNNYSCKHLLLTKKGTLVITGKTEPGSVYGEVLLTETDTLGKKLWRRTYGGWGPDYGVETQAFKDGYLVLASVGGPGGHASGFHNSTYQGWPHYNRDIWILRTNWEGLLVWQRCLGGSSIDDPANIIVDGIDITVFGTTTSTDGDVKNNHSANNNTTDVWMCKILEKGEISFQQCFGSLGSETATLGIQLRPGVYTIMSQNNLTIPGGDVQCQYWNDFSWLFSFNICPDFQPGTPAVAIGPDTIINNSAVQAQYTIVPPENAWAFDWKLEPEEAGSIEGLGLWARVEWSKGFKGNASIRTRCYNDCGWGNWSDPLVITLQNNVGLHFPGESESGIIVWPNPATNIVNFKCNGNTPTSGYAVIRIYDMLGGLITELPFTAHQARWDCSMTSPGLYFYRINYNMQSVSGRLIIKH